MTADIGFITTIPEAQNVRCITLSMPNGSIKRISAVVRRFNGYYDATDPDQEVFVLIFRIAGQFYTHTVCGPAVNPTVISTKIKSLLFDSPSGSPLNFAINFMNNHFTDMLQAAKQLPNVDGWAEGQDPPLEVWDGVDFD